MGSAVSHSRSAVRACGGDVGLSKRERRLLSLMRRLRARDPAAYEQAVSLALCGVLRKCTK